MVESRLVAHQLWLHRRGAGGSPGDGESRLVAHQLWLHRRGAGGSPGDGESRLVAHQLSLHRRGAGGSPGDGESRLVAHQLSLHRRGAGGSPGDGESRPVAHQLSLHRRGAGGSLRREVVANVIWVPNDPIHPSLPRSGRQSGHVTRNVPPYACSCPAGVWSASCTIMSHVACSTASCQRCWPKRSLYCGRS